MIEAYRTTTRVMIDGQELGVSTSDILLSEYDHRYDNRWMIKYIVVDWKNIQEYISIIRPTASVFLKQTKKGMKLYYNNGTWLDDAVKKQWKDDLNIEINISTVRVQASMRDIFNYKDVKMAIKYLKERGLSICPMANNTK